MKKLVLIIVLMLSFNNIKASNTVSLINNSETYFNDSDITSFNDNEITSIDFKIRLSYNSNLDIPINSQKNEKSEYIISPKTLCAMAGYAWAVKNGFTPGTHDFTLVAWSYYHGCMQHVR